MSDNLDLEMAAISPVKSAEIMELAKNSSDLNKMTSEILHSVNRVEAVKRILESKDDYQFAPSDAVEIDSELSTLNVIKVGDNGIVYDENKVEGAECFGLTLSPKEFRATRIEACEGFLTQAYEKVRVVTNKLYSSFHDALTLIFEDIDSVTGRLQAINSAVEKMPSFKEGIEKFDISNRVFNLLKVDNALPKDWREQLIHLNKTTTGLTVNYVQYAEARITSIMAYFSRFEGITTDEEANAILMTVGDILNNTQFKECKIPLSTSDYEGLTKKRSVEMMGGRYLINTIFKHPVKIHGLYDVEWGIDYLINHVGVKLNSRGDADLSNSNITTPTFGSDTIRHICRLGISSLNNWGGVCKKLNGYRVSGNDYESLGNNLEKLDINGEIKAKIMSMYMMVVRQHQQEALELVSDFTRYQVITLNVIAGLCNDSINFAKEVGRE